MSFSYKRIISYVNSASAQFTAQSIAGDITPAAKKKKSKKGKKKSISGKSINKIESALNLLHSIGYIEKDRKKYSKNRSSFPKGIIKVNTSGNAYLKTDDNLEIIIKKQDINNAHNNDQVLAEITDFKNGYFFGRVKSINKRQKEIYSAVIERKTGKHIILKIIDLPGSIQVCCERFSSSDNEPDTGNLAIIKLNNSFTNNIQECSILESFPVDSEEYDFKRIVIKHSLPEEHGEYRELENIDLLNKVNDLKNRKDYRGLFTITIDGEYAKDFDDAISLEISDKDYRLYIHIADVSHFVKKGSKLDKEAYSRGTSYYIGNNVIPMLPEILSNNLCSLVENEDRLTLSVEITIDLTGNMLEARFYRGIIKVNKRLTYEKARIMINKRKDDELSKLLKEMNGLAMKLKKIRMTHGRVDLNLSDQELIYDGFNCTDIIFAPRYKSHMLIEEFMLSANEAVSKILKENNIPALYRVHENISDEKAFALKKFLKILGFTLDKSKETGTALQNIIDKVSGKEYDQVINFIILKSMMQAYYGEKPLGHFGLGFRDYTHFTSPIRRYPDLIVHRCLKTLIDQKPHLYKTEELQKIGEKSSELERTAVKAERDMVKLKSCRIMKNKIGEEFNAIISGVTKIGLYVTLLDKPIEGMVPLRLLSDDYYYVKEDDFTVTGKRYGRRYTLGDKVKIKLVNVEVENMIIDFELI